MVTGSVVGDKPSSLFSDPRESKWFRQMRGRLDSRKGAPMMWNPSLGQDLGANSCGGSAIFEQHINALIGGCGFP